MIAILLQCYIYDPSLYYPAHDYELLSRLVGIPHLLACMSGWDGNEILNCEQFTRLLKANNFHVFLPCFFLGRPTRWTQRNRFALYYLFPLEILDSALMFILTVKTVNAINIGGMRSCKEKDIYQRI